MNTQTNSEALPLTNCSASSLPWWRKDSLGWPIETFKEKPVKSAIRIICQNIRKVIYKPNDKDLARRALDSE